MSQIADAALEAPPADGLLAPHRRALTIGLVLVITVAGFEALAVATAMPHAQADLGGLRLYGWTFSAFMLANLIGITVAGEQGDRHGPAPPFIVALTLFGTGLAIGGLAPSMAVLVAARAVQGLGGGALISVAYIVIARGYEERLRARMFAFMSSAWVVPGLVGPALAGALAEYVSWRAVFLGLLPLVAAGTLLTLPGLRRLGPPERHALAPTRVWRAMQLAAGAGLVLAGLTARSWFLAVPLFAVGGIVALTALRALVPRGTLIAARGLPAAIVANGLLNLAFFGTEAFVPYTITSLRGGSAVIAGLALTSATLTWTSGAWIVERIGGRVPRERTAAIGLAIVCAGILGITPIAWDAVPAWVAAVPWGVAGLGIGMAYSSLSLTVLGHARPGEEGQVSSSTKLVEVLGAALGAGIGGAVVALGDAAGHPGAGIALAFGIMACAAAAGVLAATRIGDTA